MYNKLFSDTPGNPWGVAFLEIEDTYQVQQFINNDEPWEIKQIEQTLRGAS